MDQPPSHYQLSFTARQGLLLFIGLLLALGLAYFLGLMTGLSGRPASEAAAAAPVASGAVVKPSPSALAAASSSAPASASKPESDEASRAETTPPAELHVFDDAGEPTPEPSRRILAAASTPAAARGEFWVQVLSVSSEREAKVRSARLAQHHYPTAVLPASTEKGRVYRVRVGPYPSREDAARAAEQLQTREKVRPWIVPAGQ